MSTEKQFLKLENEFYEALDRTAKRISKTVKYEIDLSAEAISGDPDLKIIFKELYGTTKLREIKKIIQEMITEDVIHILEE